MAVSPYDDLSVGNAKVTGAVPLVQDGVVFTLTGLPDGFVLDANVGDVMFNYGTAFNLVAVPAPSALALGAIGIGIVGWLRRRRS